MFWVLLFVLPGASPDLSRAEGVALPADRFERVIELEPRGGVPGNSLLARTQWKGCDENNVIHVARFLAATAAVGEKIQVWLDGVRETSPRGLGKHLFGGRARLTEAVRRARSSAFHPEFSCKDMPFLKEKRLATTRVPLKGCGTRKTKTSIQPTDYWFSIGQAMAAVVTVHPGNDAHRCLPRMSGVLFDESGTARLRVHVDYAQGLEAELLGDGCRSVQFLKAKDGKSFLPVLGRGCSEASR